MSTGQVHGPTKCIFTDYRPVPLEWHFSIRPLKKADGDGLFPLLDTKPAKKGSRSPRDRRGKSKKDTKDDFRIHPRLQHRLEALNVYGPGGKNNRRVTLFVLTSAHI